MEPNKIEDSDAIAQDGGLTRAEGVSATVRFYSTVAWRRQWTISAWLRLPTGAVRLSGANGLTHVPIQPEHHAVVYAVQRVDVGVVPSVRLSFCVQ